MKKILVLLLLLCGCNDDDNLTQLPADIHSVGCIPYHSKILCPQDHPATVSCVINNNEFTYNVVDFVMTHNGLYLVTKRLPQGVTDQFMLIYPADQCSILPN